MNLREARRAITPIATGFLAAILWVLLSPSTGAHAAETSGTWGVTYGHPYYCGDGDGDGWDMPCSMLHRAYHPAYRAHPRPLALTSYRAYSDGVNWSAIASCESGNDWAINTGNGYYGGLQFAEATWLGYGGAQFAPYANEASEADQIIVADRVLHGQGIGAWPTCGRLG